jgi:hypothetical protein
MTIIIIIIIIITVGSVIQKPVAMIRRRLTMNPRPLTTRNTGIAITIAITVTIIITMGSITQN